MSLQETTYSVLLVSAVEKFNAATLELLPKAEYQPVVVAGSLAEARRKMVGQAFDIVIINSPLPDDFGMRFAIDVCTNSNASVLMLVKNEVYNDIYAKVVGYGVMTLSKPTSLQIISQTLRIMCATRERMRFMEAKQATVEEKIAEIRLVNRAKWLLIQCLNMTESDAHRYIEKRAMDLRISKREVAETIIKTYK